MYIFTRHKHTHKHTQTHRKVSDEAKWHCTTSAHTRETAQTACKEAHDRLVACRTAATLAQQTAEARENSRQKLAAEVKRCRKVVKRMTAELNEALEQLDRHEDGGADVYMYADNEGSAWNEEQRWAQQLQGELQSQEDKLQGLVAALADAEVQV